MIKKKHVVPVLSLCVAGLLTLSASPASATVRTSAAANITIVVDQIDGPPGSPYFQFYTQNASAYMKLHPNVTISIKYVTFNQMETTDKLVLSGSNVPSLYEDNQGYLSIFKLAQDKLIIPLGQYAKQYGWLNEVPSAQLGYNGEVSLSPPIIGTGELYGLAQSAGMVGFYYSKKILARIHQPVPSTLNQFVNDMALAHKAGYIGLAMGGANTSTGPSELNFLWGPLAGSIAPSASGVITLRDVILGAPGVSWTAPFLERAAGMMKSWNDDGYLSPSVLSGTMSEAVAQFQNGNALFVLDSTYDNSVYQKMGSSQVGFLNLPSGSSTHPAIAIATGDSPFVIPTKAKDPAAIAAYLNYMAMSPQSANLFIKKYQLIPVLSVPHESSLFTGVASEAIAAWLTGSQNAAAIGYPGIGTPDGLNLINSLLQEVIGGTLSPAQFGSKMEHDETSFRATLK